MTSTNFVSSDNLGMRIKEKNVRLDTEKRLKFVPYPMLVEALNKVIEFLDKRVIVNGKHKFKKNV